MTAAEALPLALAARRASDLAACHEAAHVAMLSDDPDVAFQARACVGRLYLQRMEPLAARPWFRDARDTARAAGRLDLEAFAAHDLFVCERDLKDERAAARWSEVALELYGRNRRCGALLADLAVFRDPAETWAPFFLPHATLDADPEDRMLALSNLAESYAARGDVARVQSCGAGLLGTVRTHGLRGAAASSLLTLARSLGAVRDFDGAERVAEEAERRALECGEEVVRQAASCARDDFSHGRRMRG